MLIKAIDIKTDQEVNDYIKGKIKEWDFGMESTEMNKEYYYFGGDFEVFLMSIIYKVQIIILKNDSKGLILGTDTGNFSSFFGFGDPPARVHPPCPLYLFSYYCATNQSYISMFNHYMY